MATVARGQDPHRYPQDFRAGPARPKAAYLQLEIRDDPALIQPGRDLLITDAA